jgi:hypothetical protein
LPLCQCHNRKLSPYFKIILNLLEIPIIPLYQQLNQALLLAWQNSSVNCRLYGVRVELLTRFLEREVSSELIDLCELGGGAVLVFKRVK